MRELEQLSNNTREEIMTTSEYQSRPMHDLLFALPHLVSRDGEVDWAHTPEATLREIAAQADTAMRTTQLGIQAMGRLLALAAADVEDGQLSGATLEAFGWLITELSDFAATCGYLVACCQRHLPPDHGITKRAASLRHRSKSTDKPP